MHTDKNRIQKSEQIYVSMDNNVYTARSYKRTSVKKVKIKSDVACS